MRHLSFLHRRHRLALALLAGVCFRVPNGLWRDDNGSVSGVNILQILSETPMSRGNESSVNARRGGNEATL